MKIVLIGYMGSGKSTVGRQLAKLKSYAFIDLDSYIETAEGMTIPEIFLDKGEIYFRKREKQYLQEVLQKKENLVLATGGGTPCYANNMETILEATHNACYLKLSIAATIQRLADDKGERPLVKNIPLEELPEFIGKHLFERSFFYHQANHIVSCDGKSPDAIVEALLTVLI